MAPQETWDIIWSILNKNYKRTASYLNFRNPYELLVAVILSAQMTDEGVNAMTGALFKKYPTVQKLNKASLQEVTHALRNVNYYRTKARYLKQTAERIVKIYSGNVPSTVEELMTLSGVGRKTAVAVLANGFNKHVGIAVDTHVIRFVKRFKLSKQSSPEKIEQDLLKIIPKKNWNAASYAIKEYGRREGRARGYKKEDDPVVAQLKKHRGES